MDTTITEAALDDLAREARAVHDDLHAARAAGLANGPWLPRVTSRMQR